MFAVEEGGVTKYFYLRRISDGREFTLMRFYDPNLDYLGEQVEADDGKPVTKEEEEAVKRMVQVLFGEE